MWQYHGKDLSVLYWYIVSVLVAISGPIYIDKNLHIGHQYNMYRYIGTPLVVMLYSDITGVHVMSTVFLVLLSHKI